jgi:hypothetical protein
MPILVERRRRRSGYPSLALHYWLAEIARQNDLFALVLADSAGLLIGASLRGPEADELAAIAPLIAREDHPASYEGDAGSRRRRPTVPVTVECVAVEGDSMYLCAVGEAEQSQEGLSEASDGVHRILATA